MYLYEWLFILNKLCFKRLTHEKNLESRPKRNLKAHGIILNYLQKSRKIR